MSQKPGNASEMDAGMGLRLNLTVTWDDGRPVFHRGLDDGSVVFGPEPSPNRAPEGETR